MKKNFKLVKSGELAYLTIPSFEATGLVTHGFSTRLGGVSSAPYDQLNLGLHVGDAPSLVVQNRQRICEALGINPRHLVAAQQVHGDRVEVVTAQERGRGAVDYQGALEATDALITKEKKVPLTTYFADCVPIFILDPVTPAIGLSHAGWKGTVMKIGAKTIKRMAEKFGTKAQECLIGIGPSIGPCCYEVDEGVVERLAANFLNWETFLKPTGEGRFLLDLWQANAQALMEVGVKKENITMSGYCTHCHRSLFFSYRAQKGKTGRMAAILMLN